MDARHAILAGLVTACLMVAGCVSNDGCTVETNRKWSCPADGAVTVVVPGAG